MRACTHVCVCTCVPWDARVCATYQRHRLWLLSFKSELPGVLCIQPGLHLFESLSDKQIFKCKQYWRDCLRRGSLARHLGDEAGLTPGWLAAEHGGGGLAGCGPHVLRSAWTGSFSCRMHLQNHSGKMICANTQQSTLPGDATVQCPAPFAHGPIVSPESTFLRHLFSWEHGLLFYIKEMVSDYTFFHINNSDVIYFQTQ